MIEFEPDRRLALRGGFGPFFGDLSCALEAGGDGTVLTNAVALHALRRLGLVAPVAARQIKSAVAANLDVLRHTLEQAVF